MVKLTNLVKNVRSKNAGPFWLTIDIFCGSELSYKRVCYNLTTEAFSQIFNISSEKVKRFEIDALRVLKFSLPRPQIQGSIKDRDMHGATWASLVAEIDIE